MCNLAELEFYTVLHGRKTMVVEFDTTMSEQDFRSLVYYTSLGKHTWVPGMLILGMAIALTVGLNQKEFGIESPLHYNSQAAVFGQSVKEMQKLLELQGTGTLDNLCVGTGDLYVTVYGGRTRLVGILLGRGMDIDAARAELSGVTLESLVVAVRVAEAMKVRAARGEVDLNQFPLLMHVDQILTEKQPVNIPWEDFTFTKD